MTGAHLDVERGRLAQQELLAVKLRHRARRARPLARDPRVTARTSYQLVLRYDPAAFAGVPRDHLYDFTMYILCGMLVIGLICNWLVKPVDPHQFLTNRRLPSFWKLAPDSQGDLDIFALDQQGQQIDGGIHIARPANGIARS